jgi:hypothetical protein
MELRISYQFGDDPRHLAEDLTKAFGGAFLFFLRGGGSLLLKVSRVWLLPISSKRISSMLPLRSSGGESVV